MLLHKPLVQHQDQRKLAELYRRMGHNLALEPKGENEDGQWRNFPKETDLATKENALILQMLWGYFPVEAEVEYIKVRRLSSN